MDMYVKRDAVTPQWLINIISKNKYIVLFVEVRVKWSIEAGERLLKLTSAWEKDLSKVSKEEMVVLVKYAAQEMVRRWNMYRGRFEQKDFGQMWEVADVKSEYCESDGLTREFYKLKNGDEEKWVDVRTYLSLLDLGLIKTGIKVRGMLGAEVKNGCEKEV